MMLDHSCKFDIRNYSEGLVGLCGTTRQASKEDLSNRESDALQALQ